MACLLSTISHYRAGKSGGAVLGVATTVTYQLSTMTITPRDLHWSHDGSWLSHPSFFLDFPALIALDSMSRFLHYVQYSCPRSSQVGMSSPEAYLFSVFFDIFYDQFNAISSLSCSGLSCADGRNSPCAWGSATPANMAALASPIMDSLADRASEVHLLCLSCYMQRFPGDALSPKVALCRAWSPLATSLVLRILCQYRSSSTRCCGQLLGQ